MVFSPFPPPVPSLPLVLREVSATGSLRKMGRRHSFFETLDTAALLTDSPPKGFRRFLACSPPSTQLPISGCGPPLPASVAELCSLERESRHARRTRLNGFTRSTRHRLIASVTKIRPSPIIETGHVLDEICGSKGLWYPPQETVFRAEV
jgi:hypothetical protein